MREQTIISEQSFHYSIHFREKLIFPREITNQIFYLKILMKEYLIKVTNIKKVLLVHVSEIMFRKFINTSAYTTKC